MVEISVVTSLYKSGSYLRDFFERHIKCFNELNLSYEFVLVDDGSPGNDVSVVHELGKTFHNIKLIELSKNFGQQSAMYAALEAANGAYVLALDCDLEEEPENFLKMYEMMQLDSGIDVVFGVTKQRTGGLYNKIYGELFYKLLNFVSTTEIPKNQAWQRLMRRNYVLSLLQFKEAESLFAGLMAMTGFKQEPLEIRRNFKGQSSYDFMKRAKLALNSIVAFSSAPLIYISLLGFLITFVASVVVAIIIFRKFSNDNYQAGWSSIVVSIWMVGGLILSSVGVVGIYISKIFNQVKNRPKYLIKKITNF